jgi:hypothetical protein
MSRRHQIRQAHRKLLRHLTYVERCLVPTVKRNDIVMIDNLNPIEMPFSKLKAYLRRAGERTIPRLRRRIGSFACKLTAREAVNYFRSLPTRSM